MLGNALNADAAHSSDRQGAHQGVEALAGVFLERVDGHDGEIGFGFGVVDDIEVYQFF